MIYDKTIINVRGDITVNYKNYKKFEYENLKYILLDYNDYAYLEIHCDTNDCYGYSNNFCYECIENKNNKYIVFSAEEVDIDYNYICIACNNFITINLIYYYNALIYGSCGYHKTLTDDIQTITNRDFEKKKNIDEMFNVSK